MIKTLGTTAIVAGLSAAAFWFVQSNTAQRQFTAQATLIDIDMGETLYAESCAACHGVNLEGQADWRSPGDDGILPAPPHDKDGHTWHHGDALLFNYTKLGGKAALAQQGVDFKSGMPGFGDTLSDADIRSIIAYIKSTWPDRMQEMQASRTQGEQRQEELK